MDDRRDMKNELLAALRPDVTAADLEPVVSKHFPDLNVFRENDDLILVGVETRRLLIRRTGADRFVTSDHVAASGSTNVLDSGGEAERDLDDLINEIAAFAAR